MSRFKYGAGLHPGALLLSVGLALAAGGCGRGGPRPAPAPDHVQAEAPAVRPGPPAEPLVKGLPDFTALVERYGPTVVNVAVVEKGQGAAAADDENGGPPDPLGEFLRRFGGMPRGAQPPHEVQRGEGSGFIISADGYILTNAHVVAEASDVTVRLTDRREFTAKVIGVDKKSDVAVIRIPAKDLPTVKIGDPSRLRPGEWVVAIGSPFGFENSVTAGIVSAMSRNLPDSGYTPFIQTDAAVNPGNSGGPLFNMAGEVVGINSQIYSRTGGFMGISFAIPIDVAVNVEEQLIKTGHVERGRIGVVIQDVNQQLADSFGLDRPHGALVSQVEEGAPGAKAGLKAGDVILSVNGRSIEHSNQLPTIIAAFKPGTTVSLEIWRDRAARKVPVQIAELKEGRVKTSAAAPGERSGSERLGLTLRPLSAQEKRAAGLESGLLVEDVDGPALRAGVQQGDVIVGVNNQPVNSIDQLERVVGKTAQSVALLISRDGATLFVPLKLGG